MVVEGAGDELEDELFATGARLPVADGVGVGGDVAELPHPAASMATSANAATFGSFTDCEPSVTLA